MNYKRKFFIIISTFLIITFVSYLFFSFKKDNLAVKFCKITKGEYLRDQNGEQWCVFDDYKLKLNKYYQEYCLAFGQGCLLYEQKEKKELKEFIGKIYQTDNSLHEVRDYLLVFEGNRNIMYGLKVKENKKELVDVLKKYTNSNLTVKIKGYLNTQAADIGGKQIEIKDIALFK